MKDIPIRKPTRLSGNDYSKVGRYFVTICSKNRAKLFSKINSVGANCVRPCLSEIGQVVENEIIILTNISRCICGSFYYNAESSSYDY